MIPAGHTDAVQEQRLCNGKSCYLLVINTSDMTITEKPAYNSIGRRMDVLHRMPAAESAKVKTCIITDIPIISCSGNHYDIFRNNKKKIMFGSFVLHYKLFNLYLYNRLTMSKILQIIRELSSEPLLFWFKLFNVLLFLPFALSVHVKLSRGYESILPCVYPKCYLPDVPVNLYGYW